MIIKTPTKQALIQPSRGGWFINYNERVVESQDEDSKILTMYEYDQIWVPKLDKESIVVAIIRQRYSVNDEFKMNRLAKTTSEWKEYNEYVENAIITAGQILGEINV